jgi:hypothetical protein
MPTTLVVATSSAELQLKFLIAKTPPNPLCNFVVDPISTSFLTISMLGATTISTHVVVILTPSD